MHDRLRVTAALSIVSIPLYNYDQTKNAERPLGTYMGFDADGMITGYTGCKHGASPKRAHFQSSEKNGAFKVNPTLCPRLKHGYDSRCRDWYATGRRLSEEEGIPLYVTPPYLFSGNERVGQSCSSPLVDPITGKHVGQTLLDFLPESVINSLRPENTVLGPDGFPILITVRDDGFGNNTVVGPGFTLGGPGAPIVWCERPFLRQPTTIWTDR